MRLSRAVSGVFKILLIASLVLVPMHGPDIPNEILEFHVVEATLEPVLIEYREVKVEDASPHKADPKKIRRVPSDSDSAKIKILTIRAEEVEPPIESAVSAAPVVSAIPPVSSGVEQWRSLVLQYFTPSETEIVLCLMGYESGGKPDAYNPSGASGLMQIMDDWADDFGVTPDDLFNPATNLMIAAALYHDGGWSHWSPWLAGNCH